MKSDILSELDALIEQRKRARADESYSASLLQEQDKILKKIGEESAETIMASKDGNPDDIIHEIADLWFHTIVLLKYHNLDTKDILKELESRLGLSGLAEKAGRNP